MVSSRKKVSINRTAVRWLICIFSRWSPVKPSTYYYVLWFVLHPIIVLATYRKMRFLNQMNRFDFHPPMTCCDVNMTYMTS